ncbi:MAG: hypothetical protein KDA97_14755 [Acidimicrobiales bacterium]|nr:hypothetical protein [Acidimicrobiales bacterium]
MGLGLDDSFDPKVDPAVRVAASRLRTRLARYYATEGVGDRIVFGLPVGGYVPTIVERIERRPEVGPVVAIGAFGAPAASAEVAELAAGISESLATAVSRFQGAVTVGPVDPGPELGPVDAARAVRLDHGADLVLLGGLRVVEGTLRVTVRLLDAAAGTTIWADQFDGELDGTAMLATEDRIVEHLSSTLADEHGLIPAAMERVAASPDAVGHRALLGFYSYARSLDEGRQPEVIASLEAAVERAPGHAPYLGALASVLAFAGVGTALIAPPSAELLERAEALARRALAVDASEPYARLVTAYLRVVGDELDEGRRLAEGILADGRYTPSIRSMCGICLCLSGAWDAGIAELRIGHLLNPALPAWQHGFLALDDLANGDPTEALAHARQVDTPGLVWGPLLRAAAFGAQGEVTRGVAELELIGGFPALEAEGAELMRGHMRLPEPVVTAALAGLLPVAIALQAPTIATTSTDEGEGR